MNRFWYSILGVAGSRGVTFFARFGLAFFVSEGVYATAAMLFILMSLLRLLSEFTTPIFFLSFELSKITKLIPFYRTILLFILFLNLIVTVAFFVFQDDFTTTPLTIVIFLMLPVLFSFNAVMYSLNQRAGRFKKIARGEILASFLGGVFSLASATSGFDAVFSVFVFFFFTEIGRFYFFYEVRYLKMLLLNRKGVNIGSTRKLYLEQFSFFAPRLLNFIRINFDKIFLAFSLGSLPLAQYYFAQGIIDQLRTQLFLAFERVVSSDYRKFKKFQFFEFFSKGSLLLFGMSWGAMTALKLILFSLLSILPDWFESAYLLQIFLLLFVAFGLFGFSSEILQLEGKGFALSLVTFVNVIFVFTVILTFRHSFTIEHLAFLSVFSVFLQRVFSLLFLIHFRGATEIFGRNIWRWVVTFAGRTVAFAATATAGSQVELVAVFIAWAIFVIAAWQHSNRKQLK